MSSSIHSLLHVLFELLDVYTTQFEKDRAVRRLVYRICLQLNSMGFHSSVAIASARHHATLRAIWNLLSVPFSRKLANQLREASEFELESDSFSESASSSVANSRRNSFAQSQRSSVQSNGEFDVEWMLSCGETAKVALKEMTEVEEARERLNRSKKSIGKAKRRESRGEEWGRGRGRGIRKSESSLLTSGEEKASEKLRKRLSEPLRRWSEKSSESSKQMSESSKRLSEPLRRLSEKSKQMNESSNEVSKQLNESSKQLNESSNQMNESSNQMNESSNQMNESSNQMNESSNQMNESSGDPSTEKADSSPESKEKSIESSKSNSNGSAPKPLSETPCFCFQVERNPNDFSNSSARFHYQMVYYTCQCDQCIQNPIELFDIVDPNFESYLNSEEIEAFYLYLEFLLSIMKKPGDCFEHTFGSSFSLISCRCRAL